MIKQSRTRCTRANYDVYEILPVSKAITCNAAKWMLYKSSDWTFQDDLNEKVIMLVGGTGTGKSSLINRITNYICGVEYKDPYRFEVVPIANLEEQVNSQTKWITIYQFFKNYQLSFNLSIIDTPGFDDTRRKHKDEQTLKAIKRLFNSGAMPKLDAIGFVAQHNDARLSSSQLHIFQSIIEIFYNSVELTVFIMSTFCDDPEPVSPPVVAALQQGNINFNSIFYFNNNILAKKSELQELFWDMSCLSCKKLLDKLIETKSVCAHIKSNLLEKQDSMLVNILHIKNKVVEAINDIEQLSLDKRNIDDKERELKLNQSFNYKTTAYEKKFEKILDTKWFAVRCSICDTECHYPCTSKTTTSLRYCKVMTRIVGTRIIGEDKVHCTICPGKCSWKDHISCKEYSKTSAVCIIMSDRDLKSKYDVDLETEDVYDKIVEKWQKRYLDSYQQLLDNIKKLKDCLRDMHDNMNATNSVPQYINDFFKQLIISEKVIHKDGCEEIIERYEKLKEIATNLEDIQKKFESANGIEKLKQIQIKFF